MNMELEAYLDSVGDCSALTEPAQPVDARQCRDQNRYAACALRELALPVREAKCRFPVDELRQLGTDGASMFDVRCSRAKAKGSGLNDSNEP